MLTGLAYRRFCRAPCYFLLFCFSFFFSQGRTAPCMWGCSAEDPANLQDAVGRRVAGIGLLHFGCATAVPARAGLGRGPHRFWDFAPRHRNFRHLTPPVGVEPKT